MTIGTTFLGLDIGGTNIRMGISNGRSMIAEKEFKWISNLIGSEERAFLGGQAVQFLKETEAQPTSVGISFAGAVNDSGIVVDWPNRPHWKGLEIKTYLENLFSTTVIIDDDANASALGEHIFGAAIGFSNALVISAGTGIGAGLILNNQLYRGVGKRAGEIGHLIVDPNGTFCVCGRQGCLQAMASGRRLSDLEKRQSSEFHEIDGGPECQTEEIASRLSIEMGEWLGTVAATSITLLDLEAVILTGGLCGLGDAWWTAFVRTVNSRVRQDVHRYVLKKSSFHARSGLFGALALAGTLGKASINPIREKAAR